MNGTFQFVGSNENTLKKSVSDGIKNESASNINISAVRKSNNILLHYNITGTDALLLNSAIVLPEADTQVKKRRERWTNITSRKYCNGLIKYTDAQWKARLTDAQYVR